MNFYIKKNATLPLLKMQVVKDGRSEYQQFMDSLETATITFTMINSETGIPKIVAKPAYIVELINGDETSNREVEDMAKSVIERAKKEGKKVVFKIRSQDVLHSAYMPHFRAQMNCVPGMITEFSFTSFTIVLTAPVPTTLKFWSPPCPPFWPNQTPTAPNPP